MKSLATVRSPSNMAGGLTFPLPISSLSESGSESVSLVGVVGLVVRPDRVVCGSAVVNAVSGTVRNFLVGSDQ